MLYKTLRAIAYLLALIACIVLIATPCLADMDNPDSVTAPTFYVNRNLIEAGDFLLYLTTGVNYTSTPDDPIDDTFDFVLYDTDNTTVLGNKEAYNFVDSGYGDTFIGFYFGASDAPTWDQNYILTIRGKSSVFDDPPSYNYLVPLTAYTDNTSQSANQIDVRDNIIAIALDLAASWNVDLLDQSESGQVLSDYGQEFFRTSIPGLQAMVPDLFPVVVYSPNYPELERDWTSNQSTEYAGRYTGGEEYRNINSFWSQMLNVNFNIGAAIPIVIACLAFMYASVKQTNQPYSGMLNAAMAVVVSSPWGVIPMAMVAVGALLSGFLISFKLFRP